MSFDGARAVQTLDRECQFKFAEKDVTVPHSPAAAQRGIWFGPFRLVASKKTPHDEGVPMELGRPPMPVSLAVSDSDLDRIRYGSDVPPLLATIPPSIGQRRVAGMFMLALLASVLVTWPFANVK